MLKTICQLFIPFKLITDAVIDSMSKCETKIRISLLVFLLFCFLSEKSVAQAWEIIYPDTSNINGDLVKGIVLDGNTVYLIGNDVYAFDSSGNLQNSINARLPLQANTIADRFDIEFIDEVTAKMVYRNTIYQSNDTGQNWIESEIVEPINPDFAMSSFFDAIDFPSANVGYAVGTFKKIYKTANAGTTWEELSSDPSTQPYVWYTDVFFLDDNHGYISGFEVSDILQNFGFQGFVLKTLDGGATWERFDINVPNDFRFSKIDFKNAETGFIFLFETQQSEKILVTNDACQSWSDITPESIVRVHEVEWLDTTTGLLFGETTTGFAMLKTTDQGKSWLDVSIPIVHGLTGNTVNDIIFINDSAGYTVGAGGVVMYSNSAGENWQVVQEGAVRVFEASFPNEETAYATTGNSLFKSNTGGEDWNYLSAPSEALFNYVVRIGFIDSLQGFALGFGNQYVKTEDGFDSFETGTLPETFFFSNKYVGVWNNRIYIAGTTSNDFANKLIYTDDMGASWSNVDIGLEGSFINNFHVLDDGTLIVQSDFDLIYSEDDGSSWNSILNLPMSIQNSVFLNSDIGYTFTSEDLNQGQVRRIVDIRNPIIEIVPILPVTDSAFILGVLPINGTTLYAYGYQRDGFQALGAIWKSTDSGQTWQEEQFPVDIAGNIKQMKFTGNSVLALASQGQILRSSLDVLTSIEKRYDHLDLVVYPNPANNFVIIQHNLNREFELTLFSLQGELIIKKLLHRKEYRLDISHLQSGVYVIKAMIEDQYFTKLIVVKD